MRIAYHLENVTTRFNHTTSNFYNMLEKRIEFAMSVDVELRSTCTSFATKSRLVKSVITRYLTKNILCHWTNVLTCIKFKCTISFKKNKSYGLNKLSDTETYIIIICCTVLKLVWFSLYNKMSCVVKTFPQFFAILWI